MPIETTRIVTRHIRAGTGEPPACGGISFDVQLDGDARRLPDTITLRLFCSDEARSLDVAPAIIERAARLIEEARAEVGDFRSVCAEHGYFSGRCEGCHPPAPPAEAAPTLPDEIPL